MQDFDQCLVYISRVGPKFKDSACRDRSIRFKYFLPMDCYSKRLKMQKFFPFEIAISILLNDLSIIQQLKLINYLAFCNYN